MARSTEHEEFMKAALEQADAAARLGEVPVGAVVVREGKIIAQAHNRRELAQDPMAHAEVLAISRAAKILDSWRLEGCTLYVTLEPCPMCAGALVNARVDHLVYGCPDPKAGAVRTLYTVCDDPRLNHRLEITRGVRAAECSLMLSRFFAELRAKAEKQKAAREKTDPDDKPTVVAARDPARAPQVTVAFEAREDDKPTVITEGEQVPEAGPVSESRAATPQVTVAFEAREDDKPTIIAEGEEEPRAVKEEPKQDGASPKGRIPMAPKRKPSMAPRLIPKPRPGQETSPPGATVAFEPPVPVPLEMRPTNPVAAKGSEWPPAPGRTMGLGNLPLPDMSQDMGRPAAASEVQQGSGGPGRTVSLDDLLVSAPEEVAPAARETPPKAPARAPTAPPKPRPKAPSKRPPSAPSKSVPWGVDPTPTRDYPAQSDDAKASGRTGKKK